MNEYLFNYSKLKGRIIEMCGTQGEFSKQVNISAPALWNKFNNRVNFTQDEIIRCCSVLNIDNADVCSYFFNLES